MLATLGPADAAVAADVPPQAVGSWSMVPQTKDANGDGAIDGDGGVPRRGALSSQPSPERVGAGNRIAQPNERLIDGTLSWYLSERGFPVRLDACDSRGDRARWTITAADGSRRTLPWSRLGARTCSRIVTLGEGAYTAELQVASGARTDRRSFPVVVRNLLVVALGDSYASGEGNPRNVRSWLRGGGSFTPYWDDDACRRSVRGAPAQAALALERSDPRTSVTLVYVACSGATVDSGILAPQSGAGQSESQVEQAARILGGRAADLVTVSIGGNDVGFGSILQTCALTSDCPLARPSGGILARYGTVNGGVQAQTAGLGACPRPDRGLPGRFGLRPRRRPHDRRHRTRDYRAGPAHPVPGHHPWRRWWPVHVPVDPGCGLRVGTGHAAVPRAGTDVRLLPGRRGNGDAVRRERLAEPAAGREHATPALVSGRRDMVGVGRPRRRPRRVRGRRCLGLRLHGFHRPAQCVVPPQPRRSGRHGRSDHGRDAIVLVRSGGLVGPRPGSDTFLLARR